MELWESVGFNVREMCVRILQATEDSEDIDHCASGFVKDREWKSFRKWKRGPGRILVHATAAQSVRNGAVLMENVAATVNHTRRVHQPSPTVAVTRLPPKHHSGRPSTTLVSKDNRVELITSWPCATIDEHSRSEQELDLHDGRFSQFLFRRCQQPAG